jgi:Trypsin-like peptidase domain
MKMLKTFWNKRQDDVWQITDLKGIDLRGKSSPPEADFFPLEDHLVVTQAPSALGTIKSVMGESIVPIVAAVEGENRLRSLGTGFFVSCSGLLITAAHVITDPIERKYAKPVEVDDVTWFTEKLNFGALIRVNPLFHGRGFIFYPFEWSMLLAERRESPIPFAGMDLKLTSDIAICKIAPRIDGTAHQPLTTIQPGMRGLGMNVGSPASAVGYVGMTDVDIEAGTDGRIAALPNFELHVSSGAVLERFPDNLVKKDVSTPGPCFSFGAKIPPGMSGAPIFDREGVYVHGVVSKGLEDASGYLNHGYGSMLAPSMTLPISRLEGASLFELQKQHAHGIPVLRGGGF